MTSTFEKETDLNLTNDNPIFWLKRGVNSFGTHPRNDIKLPTEAGSAYAGIFFLRSDKVVVRTNPLAKIRSNSNLLDNVVVFSNAKELTLEVGKLLINFIKLEGKVGLVISKIGY
jgi:hypothetical protein